MHEVKTNDEVPWKRGIRNREIRYGYLSLFYWFGFQKVIGSKVYTTEGDDPDDNISLHY